MLTIIFCLATLNALVIFYYVIIQPQQHAKRISQTGGTQATPEEIDALFFASDPFNATEIQGQLDTDAVRN